MKKINFSELKSVPSGKKEIFDYGNSDISCFNEYFSLRYKRYQDRFIVESRFLWQMYQKQSKIRILLIRMEDGDLVYCYIKNVTIYPAIYLILLGKPISKSSKVENEDKVVLELCHCKHVVGFEGIGEEIESIPNELFDVKPPYYEEYYIDTQERFSEYLNKGSWRSKYSVNKLLSNNDFVFREFEPMDYLKNKELVDLWKSMNKSENKVKFETKSYKDILEWVYKNGNLDRYLIYNLFYKDKLIGCLMFLTLNELKVAYQEHNINLSRFLENENELGLDNGTVKNIGNIMFYLTTEDLMNKGFKFSYCQGVKFWIQKKSGEYKVRLNDKRIEFSKVMFRN